MPRKHEKLLQKARQNKAGWHSRDLITLLKGYGFELSTIRGDHHVFKHKELKELMITVTHPRSELPKVYVSDSVKLIDEVLEAEDTEDKDKENDDEQPS